MSDLKLLEKLSLDLCSLVIFHGLLKDGVIKRLAELIRADGSAYERVGRYASFANELFREGDDLAAYVLERVLEDDNIYVQRRARGEAVSGTLAEALKHELSVLERLSRLTPFELIKHLGYDGFLPEWKNSRFDFYAEYTKRMNTLSVHGYGIFSKHRVFTVKQGQIVAVKWPDPVTLEDLKGYGRQRKAVVDNTLALLKGRPAANVLLYGDAGTGKSSTVKAVANEFAHQGLRLVEIAKKQYGDLLSVAQALGSQPLKFILFIDDLSFAGENDDFYALKAMLEGTVFAKAHNVAVYATSNRRNLVKESFSDREGDDVHRSETIQELCSLSSRFGLSVGFFRPSKKQYLEIVHELKQQYGILMDDAELELKA
ncbi:MAG: ATP-binding protein, partial [Christensenellales bacterium]